MEWVNYCEEGGVEANIRGETVLMGSAYFMKKRKVALPRDMKLSTGVFLAVDGALTAVFAVKYQPSRNAEWALRTLKRFHIVPVLAVRSGNVTPGLIKRKFGVDAKPVYPDVSTPAGAGPAGGAAGRAALRGHLPGGTHAAGGVCGREPPGGEGCTDRHHP